MFPDPWQKARHHKRRLISPTFFKIIKPHLTDKAEILFQPIGELFRKYHCTKRLLTDFLFEEGVFTETTFETRLQKEPSKKAD